MNKEKTKEWFSSFLKGTALGLGAVPGGDAGTMGVIVGIYDKLVRALSDVFKHFRRSFKILFPVLLGALLSAVVLVIVAKVSLNNYPFATTCVFAGLVVGFLPMIAKQIKTNKKMEWSNYLLIIVAFIVAASLGVLGVLALNYNIFNFEEAFLNPTWWLYPVIFVCGFVAAGTCILPGISGSTILFILGLYNPLLDLYFGSSAIWFHPEKIGSSLGLTICLVAGAVAGLVITSKTMSTFLDKDRVKTFDVVFGFILGSLISMFVNQNIWNNYPTIQWGEYLIGGILFLLTALLAYWVRRRATLAKP
jgi:putative membrane protein